MPYFRKNTAYETKSFVIPVNIVFAGCRGSKYLSNNLAKGSIPPEITNPKYVLLVESNAHTRPGMLRSVMKKHYAAAFEVVTEKSVRADKKYNDVDKYRFIVIDRYGSGGTYKQVYPSAYEEAHHTGVSQETYSDQIVIDRKENKQFPATNLMSHSYAQGLMLFCRAVENM